MFDSQIPGCDTRENTYAPNLKTIDAVTWSPRLPWTCANLWWWSRRPKNTDKECGLSWWNFRALCCTTEAGITCDWWCPCYLAAAAMKLRLTSLRRLCTRNKPSNDTEASIRSPLNRYIYVLGLGRNVVSNGDPGTVMYPFAIPAEFKFQEFAIIKYWLCAWKCVAAGEHEKVRGGHPGRRLSGP